MTDPVQRAFVVLADMSRVFDEAVDMVRSMPCPRHVFLDGGECVFCLAPKPHNAKRVPWLLWSRGRGYNTTTRERTEAYRTQHYRH